MTTTGLLLLICTVLFCFLLGITLSFLSHFILRDVNFDGPFAVLAAGVFISAFFLFTMTNFLNLKGFSYLFLDFMVVSFGWLLTVFVERAIERGAKNASIKRNQPYLRPFHGFKAVRLPAQPTPNQGAAVLIGYGITVALIYLFNGIIKILSYLVSILWSIANALIGVLHWILEFLKQTLISLGKELVLLD